MPDQIKPTYHERTMTEYFGTHKLQPDISHEIKKRLTFGQRAADIVTHFCGTWTFIFLLMVFIFAWISLNVWGYMRAWDPWPFIILNLMLSGLATVQAPIILMSQNREAEKDRKRAEYTYYIDRKSERELALIQKELAHIKYVLQRIYHKK